MSASTTYKIHLARHDRGRIELRPGPKPPPPPRPESPARIARLVALAHRIEALVRSGEARDYAEVAALAGITRARVSQIANLLLLAPDIQEELLHRVRPAAGHDAIGEQHVRSIAIEPDWAAQRRLYAGLRRS